MNKVIEAIDAALYDTAVWLWLIPKTLCTVSVRAIGRPAWIVDYTNEECSKPAEQRFNDYMPPLVAAVLMASPPMSFAISIQLFRRKRLGRSELRSVFLPQAYLWGACYSGAFVIGLAQWYSAFLSRRPRS